MDNDQKTPAKKPISKRTIVTISVVLVMILTVTAIVYFNSRKTEITARTIVIEEILGDVSVTNDIGAAFASLNLGTRLSQGNTLTAGERSHAGLLLDSASIVKTDEMTRVGVNKVSDKELTLNVLYGAISVNAAKLDDGNIINIEAGNTVIGLRGTLFTVVYKDNVLNVPLFDGRLEITAKDGEYTLDKGYMLTVTDGLGVSDVAAIDIEVLDRFSLLTILENADALLADGLFTEKGIERVRELLYGAVDEVAVTDDVAVKDDVITAAFTDSIFLAAVREMVNKPAGDIYASDVAEISMVDVSGPYRNPGEIKSLAGIEYFAALTDLRCDRNQLMTLDISKNTALTKLTCWNNQLTTLDLSNNTALTDLQCDHNQLTALDISKNTALTKLYCGDNQLTSLDLSNNTALTELYCWNNQLTTLDLSNNTALTTLFYQGNRFTDTDIIKGWKPE